MRKRTAVLALLVACAALLLAGCSRKEKTRQSVVGYALDTVITLTAWAEDDAVLRDAMAECERWERLLSATAEGSDVWRINHAGGAATEVAPETAEILRCAAEISALSDGAFDITVAPLSALWDFKAEHPVLPEADALRGAAERVDWRRVAVSGRSVTLPEGMRIDLGGIAKGYIADAVKRYLAERGVESGILSFGGNIVTLGAKPDGSPWKVGIQDIDRPAGTPMLVAETRGVSVVTSGTYERGFDLDGVRYHHLLDPGTGWPVQNGLASVTVFAESSMRADALATAAFVLGAEKGAELIGKLPGTEAVFISGDRSVLMTPGAGTYFAAAGE